MTKLKFGTFLAPIHKPGQNPTLLLQRDLEFVTRLEELGYDEAWFGEHHSAGSEIYASPEIMIAAAGERTKRIKLGTGVTSVSYHNPLWAAEWNTVSSTGSTTCSMWPRSHRWMCAVPTRPR